jgi:hypothetical protein
VRWSAPRKQRQEMSSGPSSVSCIQTRSTRADEECCARICLQRHSHQRGLPRGHRNAHGCRHGGQGTRHHEGHPERAADWATWSA